MLVAYICPTGRKIIEIWGMQVYESTLLMNIYKSKYFLTAISSNKSIYWWVLRMAELSGHFAAFGCLEIIQLE